MLQFSAWAPVPDSRRDGPVDLYRFCAIDNGYELQLTDLCDVWCEILTSSAIIERVSDLGSSINPGQDASQFDKLLSNLEKALSGASGTKYTGRRQCTETSVLVDVKCKLPSGMSDFKWQFHLSLRSKADMRDCVILPLAVRSYTKNSEIEGVMKHLQEKDAAISKLLDKFESSGVDAASIIPMVMSNRLPRKAGVKEQVLQHMRGLQPYEEHQISDRVSRLDGEYMSSEMLRSAFASTASNANGQIHTTDPSVRPSAGLTTDVSISDTGVNASGDGDYQRQVTSPQLHRAHEATTTNEHHDEQPDYGVDSDAETTDEDLDLDAGASQARTPAPRDPVRAVSKPAEAVEEPIVSASPVSAASIKAKSPAKKLGSTRPKEVRTPIPELLDVDAKDRYSNRAASKEASEPETVPTDIAASSKTKVKGKIGGKKHSSTTVLENTSNEKPAPQRPPIGASGPRNILETVEVPPSDKLHQATAEVAEPPTRAQASPIREKSQERADRKRRLLRDQLEAQSKAATKKKRKF